MVATLALAPVVARRSWRGFGRAMAFSALGVLLPLRLRLPPDWKRPRNTAGWTASTKGNSCRSQWPSGLRGTLRAGARGGCRARAAGWRAVSPTAPWSSVEMRTNVGEFIPRYVKLFENDHRDLDGTAHHVLEQLFLPIGVDQDAATPFDGIALRREAAITARVLESLEPV
jgi:hypothetical protein